MSDLIDREAVREFIKSYRHSTDAAFHMEGHLDEIPAASPWHRVEEELPDKYTQCLVIDADGKCAVGYYRYDCEAWDSPAFGWIESEDRIYIDDMPMGIGKVVAWMPIEPPKEDADGQDNASCS